MFSTRISSSSQPADHGGLTFAFHLSLTKNSRPDQIIPVPPEADILVVPERFPNSHARLRWGPGSAAVRIGDIGTVDHPADGIPIDHRQVQVGHDPAGLRHNRAAD